MTIEKNTSDLQVSNWTLATGTRPGERQVYPTVPQSHAQPSASGARS